jgi:eukaryotic-like serine/threonine-protein kinase
MRTAMATAQTRLPYPPGTLLPGSIYVLGEVLGKGASAIVFAAEDSKCGRQVVVKVVRPEVARKGSFTAAEIQREARTLVALHEETEHVVEVITAGVSTDEQQLPYYVMERLNGQPLRETLDRRQTARAPISIADVTSLFADLAVALKHVHAHRIIHLDVKPDNAFVHQRRDGVLVMKLLDFGISTMLDRTMGGFKGTYRYASPEQLRGERVSAATDIYALGVVMYEALALRRPFDPPGTNLTLDALVHAQCELPPPPLETLRPDAPYELVRLVMACLAKRPEHRPSSAEVIAGVLHGLRRPVANVAGPSYLETLTNVAIPADVAQALERASMNAAPRSEVFVTAALPPKPPDPRFSESPLGSATHSPAVISGGEEAAEPGSRGIRTGAALAGLVGMIGLVVVGDMMLLRARPSALGGAAGAEPAGPSASVPPAAASPAAARDPTPQPTSIPSATVTPSASAVLRTPPMPQEQAHSGRSHRQGPSGAMPPAAPAPPAVRTAPVPSSITTQKDWF